MLAVDVPDLLAQVLGRDELIDGGVDQHARGVDPRLVAEDVATDPGLRRLDRDPRHPLHQEPEVPKHVVPEAGYLDAEQVAELQQDLVHGHVARALADAVDGGREDVGAASERHHRVPGAKPEVIVEVHHQ